LPVYNPATGEVIEQVPHTHKKVVVVTRW